MQYVCVLCICLIIFNDVEGKSPLWVAAHTRAKIIDLSRDRKLHILVYVMRAEQIRRHFHTPI